MELETARASHAGKAETVVAVHERLKAAKMAIVTEYRGLTVGQMTRLRREIRHASGEYQVIKNTLVRRALKGTAYEDLERMPSKPELQAKLLAMIQAPATQLVRLMQEPGARVVRLLETLRKGKSEQ